LDIGAEVDREAGEALDLSLLHAAEDRWCRPDSTPRAGVAENVDSIRTTR